MNPVCSHVLTRRWAKYTWILADFPQILHFIRTIGTKFALFYKITMGLGLFE